MNIRSRRRSKNRRLQDKFNREEIIYDDFLDSYFRLDDASSTHPLFLCSSYEFSKLKENTILLCNPSNFNDPINRRKIRYNVERIGKNVSFMNKNGVMKLNVSNTKRNVIFIMIHRKHILQIPKINIHEYANKNIKKKKRVQESLWYYYN